MNVHSYLVEIVHSYFKINSHEHNINEATCAKQDEWL